MPQAYFFFEAQMYKPELFNTFKDYSGKQFVQDLIAGVIVGIVALPLSIAFAIASGCGPETGLYTAVLAGFCIAAFGGTRCQIGGPTGAFTVIIYAIVNNPDLGFSGLATATVLAGIILILLGAFKLGGLVKFIPYTIVVGFTAGIAITIASGQIGDFFGLNPVFPLEAFGRTYEKMPGTFVGKILVYAVNFRHIDIYSTVMSVLSLVLLFLWPKITRKIPGSLAVIVIATVLGIVLERAFSLKVSTIGRFADGGLHYNIPRSLPVPHLPDLRFSTVLNVLPTALSIAVLAAIESLLSAVVADGMTGTKHDSNNELVGQGIANIVSPLFGGLPATGAIARTATNINNGGRTPVAGIIHALTLFLIVVFFGRYVEYVPMPALAAVLMSVAWHMAGIPSIRKLLKGQKSDVAVLGVTFLVTVFVDLTYAIGIGLIFSAFFFIKKMVDLSSVLESKNSIVAGITGDGTEEKIEIPEAVVVYEVDGPLFFGTVRKFELASEWALSSYRVMVVQMRNTAYLDAGGVNALAQCMDAAERRGVRIVLSDVKEQPMKLLVKSGMIERIGAENVCSNISSALERAGKIAAR